MNSVEKLIIVRYLRAESKKYLEANKEEKGDFLYAKSIEVEAAPAGHNAEFSPEFFESVYVKVRMKDQAQDPADAFADIFKDLFKK